MLENLNLDKEAKSLESKRKRLYILHKAYKIFILPIFHIAKASSVVMLFVILIFPPLLVYLIVSGSVCILTGIIPAPKKIYRSNVKQNVMQSIFESINSNLKYSLYDLNIETIKQSGLFNKKFIRDAKYIVGEDTVSGSIDDISITFTEIKFYKDVINYSKTVGGCLLSILLLPLFIIRGIMTTTQEDDDLPIFGIIRDEIIFYKGLFMCAEFKSEFKGNFLIIPNEYLSKINRFSKESFGNPISEVKAAKAGLANNYKLFCTDERLEKQLLDSSIISTLNSIYLKGNMKSVVSFIDGKMHITVPNKTTNLSFTIDNKVTDSRFFMPYLKAFNAFENTIKAIQQQI
ncbi:DUF3137 domain-containing protein [Winogradskyella sp.]|jgi:hypothetical protein|uniref:DUF3137 domain-containing protein n=1 Tax=Winogradskyella sp. TaxID=1883156 RepID=UPI0025FB14A6|nr:DUF3137 domain-containing protein [Winogradskyella sp.]MCT4629346.1 DUF3137 domain-containing protein [Winogradskyella sp.]